MSYKNRDLILLIEDKILTKNENKDYFLRVTNLVLSPMFFDLFNLVELLF